MSTRCIHLAVTLGDPAGIGPEIVARRFAGDPPRGSRAVLIGAPEALDPWRGRFGLDAPVLPSADALDGDAGRGLPPVVVLDTGVRDPFSPGTGGPGGGKHAGRAIEVACELVNSGRVDGIVTAPISKKSLNSGGFHYPGHTEMLARYLNSPQCQMVMAFGELRVVPLTRHLPLRKVPDAITADSIMNCVQVTRAGLMDTFGVTNPRIAVAGLNPHAGDGGVLGDEEHRIIAPALAALREDGVDVEGPFAADALFQRAAEAAFSRAAEAGSPRDGGARVPRAAEMGRSGPGEAETPYDAYIAMYHDQGLVAFKALARRRGVNVTVGLPVIRTSPDHGTAYDIAGRGVADAGSLREAYQLAEDRAAARGGSGGKHPGDAQA